MSKAALEGRIQSWLLDEINQRSGFLAGVNKGVGWMNGGQIKSRPLDERG